MADCVALMDEDEQFFAQHADRRARIRVPRKQINVDSRTRQTRVFDECEWEFRSLGPHARDRRRILVWRVPHGNPAYDPARQPLLKIPFLLFADETVEDRDDILLPIIHQIMVEARNSYER